eukprot:jgi/Botrbrau1/18379/Bobra.0403s0003.1
MIKLRCPVQNYAWGRLGKDSCEVAALAAAGGEHVDPQLPYAELWMGTHTSGPALLVADNKAQTLKAWLDNHPEALGNRVLQRFGSDLPFLFKVLSVQTALSIQSHPDKALAEKLHAERPEVYKDGNHKPEMAIAITDNFSALCGFAAQGELVVALKTVPELQEVIGDDRVEAMVTATSEIDQKAALQKAFTALMTADEEKVAEIVDKLVLRLDNERKFRELTSKEELVLTLNKQYPKDVGILSAFFLNLVTLNANEAIYLPANEPHAYISGELVECMATSDNVIRAGLTPKLRDTSVLCSSLTYSQGRPEVLIGEEVQEYTKVYSPPFEEFEVFRVDLPASASTILPGNQGPTIVLVMQGEGSIKAVSRIVNDATQSLVTVGTGGIFFVPAQTSLEISAAAEDLLLWIAAVNSSVFSDTFRLHPGSPTEIETTVQHAQADSENIVEHAQKVQNYLNSMSSH